MLDSLYSLLDPYEKEVGSEHQADVHSYYWHLNSRLMDVRQIIDHHPTPIDNNPIMVISLMSFIDKYVLLLIKLLCILAQTKCLHCSHNSPCSRVAPVSAIKIAQ